MSDHRFKNPDKIQQLPQRDFIRNHMPNGRDGFVAEDLDLVVRWFGNPYRTDRHGKFALIEMKHGRVGIGPAKEKTFGLIDSCLRKGDPGGLRYLGYYLIQTETAYWEECDAFVVNGTTLTQAGFLRWLNTETSLPPYTFKAV